jgi:hypothetical protein
LGLEITDHARIPYASLGSDDRRDVDAWIDHLRDWHDDEVIRSKARRLRGGEEIYIVPTNNDLFVAFEITRETVKVLSIYGEETLRAFGVLSERSAV